MLYHTNPYRKSTSDIPSTNFQNVDYTTNVPKLLYTKNDQPFSPTSPTFSFVTENIQNELNVLETNFIVNKKYFIDDFYGNYNSKKRSCFFKNFMQERKEIQKCFYDFVALYIIQILFFD